MTHLCQFKIQSKCGFKRKGEFQLLPREILSQIPGQSIEHCLHILLRRKFNFLVRDTSFKGLKCSLITYYS